MKKMVIIILPIILFLLIWIFSLIKCEILTFKYGHEFDKEYQTVSVLGEVEKYKVINYSVNQARLYYISNNFSNGDILTFIKENDEWKYMNWESLWSVNGNADNFIWPYWWHFFYSHKKLRK